MFFLVSLLGRAEAIIKQFASQELQVEKEKIREYHAGNDPRITGYQADTGRGKGGAETEFPDRVEKSKRETRVVGIEIEIGRNRNKALEDPWTAPSSKKASSNKDATAPGPAE